jgi:SAM-dependent methyltransferase
MNPSTPPASTPASPLAVADGWNAVAEGYAADLAPRFANYASDALALADPPKDAHVLDVACGPGTLALLAAERVEQVVALDFAEEMLGMLRRRAAEHGMSNIEIVHGDGQSLPFEDGSFDAAFSMFGLMFFPDRAAGFRELFRVLKPGGQAVVSSWPPSDEVPMMVEMFDAVRLFVEGMPKGGNMPLTSHDEFRAEMTAAGFTDVAIHVVSYAETVPSMEAFWEMNVRSSAPIAMLRRRLGEQEWTRVAQNVVEHLRSTRGDAPIDAVWKANLGIGTKP